MMRPMSLRSRTLALAAILAAALPALLAGIASGSCSLADLYSGGDASADGQGGSTSSTASTTTSAGTGGMDGGLDADAAACPPDMVTIQGSAGTYCIESTEVTNARYREFLHDLDGSVLKVPPDVCGWKTSHAPYISLDGGDSLPVLGVDWCDAYAYCAWKGRRLCGAVNGGAIDPDKRDSNLDQWFAACAKDTDNQTFPYGYVFDVTACADCNPDAGCDPDASSLTSHPADAGSMPACEGAYDGLFDMSGNASEWEDSCEDAGVLPDASDDGGAPIKDPRYDLCHHRGGSYLFPRNGATALQCLACVSKYCKAASEARKNRPRDTGVRCCLDLSGP
jgi:formylglycine-generating enzyme required for sulfatase activity